MMTLSSFALHPIVQWVVKGGWNIADCVERSYDVEGMHVGTVAPAVSARRAPPPEAFDMHLHYTQRHRLPENVGERAWSHFSQIDGRNGPTCDVVQSMLRCTGDGELFDEKMIGRMSWCISINNARARICNRDAIVRRWRLANSQAMPETYVSATGAQRSSLADHAAPRHDAATFPAPHSLLRRVTLPVPGDPRMLV